MIVFSSALRLRDCLIRSASIFAVKTDQTQEKLQGLVRQGSKEGISLFLQDGFKLFSNPVQPDLDISEQGGADPWLGFRDPCKVRPG
jgi:hypothetical protein